MEQDKKIDFSKRKVKSNQKIWNYIRRNKIFRAGDVLIVCETSYTYFAKYLRFLEKSGYVEFIKGKRNTLSNREYRLVKNTGVKAPLVSDNSLFDYNTNECFDYSPEKKRKIEIPENLMKILSSIKQEEITIPEIIEKANITEVGLEKWWARLKKVGVICGQIEINEMHPTRYYLQKYKRKGRKFLYKYDVKRAKEVKKALEEGAYHHFNTELKNLWIH